MLIETGFVKALWKINVRIFPYDSEFFDVRIVRFCATVVYSTLKYDRMRLSNLMTAMLIIWEIF